MYHFYCFISLLKYFLSLSSLRTPYLGSEYISVDFIKNITNLRVMKKSTNTTEKSRVDELPRAFPLKKCRDGSFKIFMENNNNVWENGPLYI